MAFTDIALNKKNSLFFDFEFADGDFVSIDGFENALLMSMFCQKRASASQVPTPQNRRGWWGNEALGLTDYNIGSTLWILSQAREDLLTLKDAKTFTEDSAKWFLEDGFLDEVRVVTSYKRINGLRALEIFVELIRFHNSVLSRGFRIWQNTTDINVIEE